MTRTMSGPSLVLEPQPHLLAALWRWADEEPDRPLLSRRSGARLALAETPTHRALLTEAATSTTASIEVLTIDEGALTDLRSLDEHHLDAVEARIAALTPDDLAAVLYSSGTTGEPKGCELTHGNLCANVRQTVQQVLRLFEKVLAGARERARQGGKVRIFDRAMAVAETAPIVTGGRPCPATTIRLADDGEILVRGPQVFRGYRGDPEATARVLEDGWYHTGDLGAFTPAGHLRIIGRKKDILVTAGGKNVVPAPLEDRIRGELDVVVEAANRTVSRAESIGRYAIITEPLSLEAGSLTPTAKVRRAVVLEHYADPIDQLYRTS